VRATIGAELAGASPPLPDRHKPIPQRVRNFVLLGHLLLDRLGVGR